LSFLHSIKFLNAFDLCLANKIQNKFLKRFTKGVLKASNVPKPVLIIAMFFFKIFRPNVRQGKPAGSGLVPVNGIKVYYEVYGEGGPIVLLHYPDDFFGE
jgi:hypothetical protein